MLLINIGCVKIMPVCTLFSVFSEKELNLSSAIQFLELVTALELCVMFRKWSCLGGSVGPVTS